MNKAMVFQFETRKDVSYQTTTIGNAITAPYSGHFHDCVALMDAICCI